MEGPGGDGPGRGEAAVGGEGAVDAAAAAKEEADAAEEAEAGRRPRLLKWQEAAAVGGRWCHS